MSDRGADGKRMGAILEAGGPDFKVTVDPNERFRTAEQTIELAAELELLGNVEVFERSNSEVRRRWVTGESARRSICP